MSGRSAPGSRAFRLGFWLGLLSGAAAALLLGNASGDALPAGDLAGQAGGRTPEPQQTSAAPLPRQDGAPL